MWRCWTSPNHNPSLPRRRGLEFASDCGRMAGERKLMTKRKPCLTRSTCHARVRTFAASAGS
jgi:hypothetical protein